MGDRRIFPVFLLFAAHFPLLTIAIALPAPIDLSSAVNRQLFLHPGIPICFSYTDSLGSLGPLPPSPLVSPNPTDCSIAGTQMAFACPAGPPLTALTLFSSQPVSGPRAFQLPLFWRFRSCTIELETFSFGLGADLVSWAELGMLASETMSKCVEQGERLGGRLVTGQANRLKLSIYGTQAVSTSGGGMPAMAELRCPSLFGVGGSAVGGGAK